jgi:hypothetical protein
MVAEMLESLAAGGANALVAAMATNAWTLAKTGIARLFRRTGREQQAGIEEQLDRNAALVEQAEDGNSARQSLAGYWQLELKTLLARDPDAAEELRALITKIQERLPPAQQAWVQTNIARDQSSLFAAQGGNVIVHHMPPDRPPAPDAWA